MVNQPIFGFKAIIHTKWLRHGPALLSVGEARVAVVDAASGMALTFHMGHVGMKVKAASDGLMGHVGQRDDEKPG